MKCPYFKGFSRWHAKQQGRPETCAHPRQVNDLAPTSNLNSITFSAQKDMTGETFWRHERCVRSSGRVTWTVRRERQQVDTRRRSASPTVENGRRRDAVDAPKERNYEQLELRWRLSVNIAPRNGTSETSGRLIHCPTVHTRWPLAFRNRQNCRKREDPGRPSTLFELNSVTLRNCFIGRITVQTCNLSHKTQRHKLNVRPAVPKLHWFTDQ